MSAPGWLPVLGMCLGYFAIGWTATTDILRLCRGATHGVWELRCYCDACGGEVPVSRQIPYWSYFRYGGRCSRCGAKIPISNVLLEAIVFLPMCLLSWALDFRPMGVLLSFGYYELLKLGYILRCGRRAAGFGGQLLRSLGLNLLCCLLICFLALLRP